MSNLKPNEDLFAEPWANINEFIVNDTQLVAEPSIVSNEYSNSQSVKNVSNFKYSYSPMST